MNDMTGIVIIIGSTILVIGGIKGTWKDVFHVLMGQGSGGGGGGSAGGGDNPGGTRPITPAGSPSLLPGQQPYTGGGPPPGFHLCDNPGGGVRLCPDSWGTSGCPPTTFLQNGRCVPKVGPDIAASFPAGANPVMAASVGTWGL